MKLSIIIVNYKSREQIENCLVSLRRISRSDSERSFFEIIVVNNDNEILKLADKQVKIINTWKNVGFGAANNSGAKQARGEFLLFLNPDTEIISENIGELLNEFKKNAQIGIIGAKLVTRESAVQRWSAGSEIGLWDIIKNNLGFPHSRKIWESGEKIFCDWVSGAAMFIRKDLFEKLGGFDEKFFMYFEDIDLCRRARGRGYGIIYYPAFIVNHLGGKSFIEKAVQKKYYYASQDYYFQKHFGKFTALWVKTLRKIFS